MYQLIMLLKKQIDLEILSPLLIGKVLDGIVWWVVQEQEFQKIHLQVFNRLVGDIARPGVLDIYQVVHILKLQDNLSIM